MNCRYENSTDGANPTVCRRGLAGNHPEVPAAGSTPSVAVVRVEVQDSAGGRRVLVAELRGNLMDETARSLAGRHVGADGRPRDRPEPGGEPDRTRREVERCGQ